MVPQKIFSRFTGALALSSLLIFSTPTHATPIEDISSRVDSYSNASSTEELADQLLSYAIFDQQNNIIAFDAEGARNSGAPEIVIEAAQEFNNNTQQTRPLNQYTRNPGNSIAAGWEVHGNWCGPGHSGPGEPIDLLDSRCKDHDLCYGEKGYFNKSCDFQLVTRLTVDIVQGKYKGSVLAKAIAIRAVFTPNSIILPNPIPYSSGVNRLDETNIT
ncbi:hypothetical protein E4U03_03235 [Rothia nasimurium]|uniref:Phospholipase n=1 Tax=Rothia nasimurium TaxID=85336 RepID=A0A4Y9F6L0_9MICC|nr:hypothetical protein [Rothia nasimurium]MBF0807631.1 hypothetical protein [Rothia nasimurium]TFU23367.1 hypothetical protein E4U03_03235 [Rothia nasimurium]